MEGVGGERWLTVRSEAWVGGEIYAYCISIIDEW